MSDKHATPDALGELLKAFDELLSEVTQTQQRHTREMGDLFGRLRELRVKVIEMRIRQMDSGDAAKS